LVSKPHHMYGIIVFLLVVAPEWTLDQSEVFHGHSVFRLGHRMRDASDPLVADLHLTLSQSRS